MRLLFEPRHEPARPLQCRVEIVHAKEQEEPVSWCRAVRTHQGGVLVGAPGVEAEQNRSVRVEELAKIVVLRCRLRGHKTSPHSPRPGAPHPAACQIHAQRVIDDIRTHRASRSCAPYAVSQPRTNRGDPASMEAVVCMPWLRARPRSQRPDPRRAGKITHATTPARSTGHRVRPKPRWDGTRSPRSRPAITTPLLAEWPWDPAASRLGL